MIGYKGTINNTPSESDLNLLDKLVMFEYKGRKPF